MQSFSRKLKAFASLCPWIDALNPEELCNSSGRIQHSIEITPGNKKTKDMIYLKSTKAAEAAEAAEQAKYLESQRDSEEPFYPKSLLLTKHISPRHAVFVIPLPPFIFTTKTL